VIKERNKRLIEKNRGLLGKCALEVKTDLDLVYGENALPYPAIARWVSMFREDRS
jgi:hypothetical protein